MNTEEDTQGLRKILDFTRLISLFILAIHFYISCYQAFEHWGWTAALTDRVVLNIAKTGLFTGMFKAKLAALLFLCISLLGLKGKKDEKIQRNSIVAYLASGLLVYLVSVLVFYLPCNVPVVAALYIALSVCGYLLVLTGGTWLSRLIKNNLQADVFNSENETFPQEERLLENEHSFNLPTVYNLKGKTRDGWINCVNPYRSVLVAGSGGAGKTYFVIRHIMDQQIKKGFSMFIYDFKFDDLTRMAYNKLLKYQDNYKVKPAFYIINFEDLNRTHRCNPLDPGSMEDIADAAEASRTNMLKIDISQIGESGDTFFSASDSAYLVFLVIGIVGYFTVPNVANYIVHAGGGNAILQKVNSLVVGGGRSAMNATGAAGGMAADAMGNAYRKMRGGEVSDGNDYMKDKIAGGKNG
ncbi:YWFCY domain-containing protein [Pedobacter soli]|uniref:YWFCY protein n=1 Tax=Pedobacter soli TaxID=390242 RepID=A0A1G6WNL0_9SPHI|nr:YWFCY domain-containing protein [Pedobacter soli]SDD67253.1 YWFCY protein [Pedobacter soli]